LPISEDALASTKDGQRLPSLLSAFRVDLSSKREASFAFSIKSPMPGWVAHSFNAAVPFFLVDARGARATQIYSFASGINKEAFILLANLGDRIALVIRRPGKEGDPYLRLLLQKEEDYERAIGILRRIDLVSDALTAHANLSDAVGLLRVGAERHFVNLGLFSNYFLRERMARHLSERGRRVEKETNNLFNQFGGEIPTDGASVTKVLAGLGFKPMLVNTGTNPEYRLLSGSTKLDAICVVTKADSLDTKKAQEVVPSYQAVSALKHVHWVILTNGRLWRLYSSRVSSSSTNYFEIDLEGVASESDPRLHYFVSLFSAAALMPKETGSDLDSVFEGGLKYAQEIKDELSSKVFEGQLFLNLVRAVIDHSDTQVYRDEELESAKAMSLRLLYRILFVLYAESRNLLPTDNSGYQELSLQGVRAKLAEFQKVPEGDKLWRRLGTLFETIEKGSVQAGVPAYDGELFRKARDLDGLELKNKYLVQAIRELTELDGKGIDYQNLGVRHLGSLYEGLLEYDVRQAMEDMVVYHDGTLDAAYAADLKAKPKPFVSKGDIYLSSLGIARKGTGSYYTPDELVKFLARNGLQSVLESRRMSFEEHIAELSAKNGRDSDLEKTVIDDLLGIKVVDPAMGSGHFLVAVVDEITSWVMDRLKDHPEAPLARMIDEDRERVLNEQRTKGIEISTELLSDSIILKRLVMKRCVYGVDINALAVELAKLSLWLDSFTIGTPLTFLDHHIRVGDSLVGLWLKNMKSKASLEGTLDSWVEEVKEVGLDVSKRVSMPPDLTLEEVEESRKVYGENRKRTDSARLMLDLMTAQILSPEESSRLPLNFSLIEKSLSQARKPAFWGEVEKAEASATKFRAFHWELEFPDACSDSGIQFDLIIMNPPWEAVRPYDDDFFSQYDPMFRRLSTKTSKDDMKKKLLKNKNISALFDEYMGSVQKRLNFFKSSGEYQKRGTGGIAFDYWALFLERAIKLLASDGTLSVILPSGLIANESATNLRKMILSKRIRSLYEFENAAGIFRDIHRSYKFVLLIVDNAQAEENFSAAFYLHEMSSLEGSGEKDKFVTISKDFVEAVSPESYSIPEVRNQKYVDIIQKLYANHPLISQGMDGWSFTIIRELNRTEAAPLFRTDGNGWLLLEGKNFHQFIVDFEKPEFTILREVGLKQTAKIREIGALNDKFHNFPRLVFRDVASSTNVRSMVACILPKNVFTPNTASIVLPRFNGVFNFDREYLHMISYLAGIFNSMVFDFLMRNRITMHLSFFFVYQTPIPAAFSDKTANEITRISARLSASDERFADYAGMLGVEYGRMTMRERIGNTAELNALVAYHYGITKIELQTILDSFDGFAENKELIKVDHVANWSEMLIRELNGEVRKRVMEHYDSIVGREGVLKP